MRHAEQLGRPAVTTTGIIFAATQPIRLAQHTIHIVANADDAHRRTAPVEKLEQCGRAHALQYVASFERLQERDRETRAERRE